MARKDSEDVKRIREIMKSIPRCAMGSTNADKVQILLEEIMYYCLEKGIDYGHASFLAEEEFGKMTGEEFTDYRETKRPAPAAATQEAPAAPSNGSWSYSPQKGKPGECFLAQVWDGEGKELATVKATDNENVATSIAQLFAASPWLVHACNAALAAMNEMAPIPDHTDPGAIDDCKREIQEAINKATRP